jgi:hypothetical protein
LGKEVFQAQGGALGCLVQEKLEGSMVRLKLLVEERMVGSLLSLDSSATVWLTKVSSATNN